MYFKQCIIKNIIIYDGKSFILYLFFLFFSILFIFSILFNLFYLIIFLKIPIRNHLQRPYLRV